MFYKIIIKISFFLMSINCWSQNQRIVIDKKNIEEQFLHFDIRLDGITYNAYLSNTNSDSIFTSPNEDHIGFIEKKTHNHDNTIQKRVNIVKGKKNDYIFIFKENFISIELTIKKVKKHSEYDLDIYNMFYPTSHFTCLHDNNDLTINAILKKSKQKYLLINVWSPFCEPCLKSFNILLDAPNHSIELLNLSEEEYNESTKSTLLQHKLIGHIYFIKKSDLSVKISGYPNYSLYDIKSKKLLLSSSNINSILNYAYKKNLKN